MNRPDELKDYYLRADTIERLKRDIGGDWRYGPSHETPPRDLYFLDATPATREIVAGTLKKLGIQNQVVPEAFESVLRVSFTHEQAEAAFVRAKEIRGSDTAPLLSPGNELVNRYLRLQALAHKANAEDAATLSSHSR